MEGTLCTVWFVGDPSKRVPTPSPAFPFPSVHFHPILSSTRCHQSASVTGPTEWTRDGPVSRSLCLPYNSDDAHTHTHTPAVPTPCPFLWTKHSWIWPPLWWAIHTAFMWGRGKACGKLVQNYNSGVPVAGRSVGWLPGELPLLWQCPCLPALVSVLALLDRTCRCPCLCYRSCLWDP